MFSSKFDQIELKLSDGCLSTVPYYYSNMVYYNKNHCIYLIGETWSNYIRIFKFDLQKKLFSEFITFYAAFF